MAEHDERVDPDPEINSEDDEPPHVPSPTTQGGLIPRTHVRPVTPDRPPIAY